MTERITRKIVVNGKDYASVEEMPADVRGLYEKAMSVLADKNANGIPDILEGEGPAMAEAAKSLAGLASGPLRIGSSTVTLKTTVISSGRMGGGGGSEPAIAAGATVTGASGVRKLGAWLVPLLIVAGAIFALRLLGVIS